MRTVCPYPAGVLLSAAGYSDEIVRPAFVQEMHGVLVIFRSSLQAIYSGDGIIGTVT
jgi:hypothetical protein